MEKLGFVFLPYNLWALSTFFLHILPFAWRVFVDAAIFSLHIECQSIVILDVCV